MEIHSLLPDTLIDIKVERSFAVDGLGVLKSISGLDLLLLTDFSVRTRQEEGICLSLPADGAH